MVAHMGEHVLEGGATLHLYTAFRCGQMPLFPCVTDSHMSGDACRSGPSHLNLKATTPHHLEPLQNRSSTRTPCLVCHVCRDALMFRLGYMGPVRSVQPKSAGFLSAPYGEAAICFMVSHLLLHATWGAWQA